MAQKYRNLFYYNSKTIDLAKLREDAARHATGDIYNPTQRVTIIHHHDHERLCKGYWHEKFTPGTDGPTTEKYQDTGVDL